MAGTHIGTLKQAAKRIGIPFDEYLKLDAQGLRWCYSCRQFKSKKAMTSGRASICKLCQNMRTTASRYGFRFEDFKKFILESEGRCDICQRPSEYLEVDHDHTTGEVRGLLCTNCNKSLGFFGDSIPMLERAIKYLKRRRNNG